MQSYQWAELPIYDDIIAQVRYLAEREDTMKLIDNYPMF